MGYVTNFVLSSVLILTPLFTSAPVNPSSPVAITPPVERATSPVVKSLAITPSQIAIREKVQTIFGEDMVETIACESNFRQFNSRGEPLISDTSDVGVMQINQVHWARAKSLGLDIFYSVDDNIIMGKIILNESGIGAWTCSGVGT